MYQRQDWSIWRALDEHAQYLNASGYALTPGITQITNQILNFSEISLDFSAQKIQTETLVLLENYAEICGLKNKIDALFLGEKINVSENRAALHTALREMQDVSPEVVSAREQMRFISEQVRSGNWLGCTGKIITDIVNIGMGGSDFSPRLGISALVDYVSDNLHYHFISDIDAHAFKQTLQHLNPETTLFIVVSKTFTTQETLVNAQKAFYWVDHPAAWKKQFIAVTAQRERAEALGIEYILPIWEWVGGRYSFCSAVNLMTCIAIGYEAFVEILSGAFAMDQHFRAETWSKNLPVMLALLGFWNINFLHNSSLLMLTYAKRLEMLVPFIQQLDMESNGKSVDLLQRPLPYMTGPIVWGGLGNQAQHSYYQLLLEGQHRIAAEFISIKTNDNAPLNEFCYRKMDCLLGRVPITHIQLKSCTPYNLGLMVALYEHKIYTQSVLWDINAFDQPGVELAKSKKGRRVVVDMIHSDL